MTDDSTNRWTTESSVVTKDETEQRACDPDGVIHVWKTWHVLYDDDHWDETRCHITLDWQWTLNIDKPVTCINCIAASK